MSDENKNINELTEVTTVALTDEMPVWQSSATKKVTKRNLFVTASAGTVTINGGADDIIIENSASGGGTIYVPDASTSQWVFGSPSDSSGANVQWTYDTKLMSIGSATSGGLVSIKSDDGTEAIRIDASQNVGFGVTNPDTKVEILKAGDQLKLSFDGTDNCVFAVDTNGDLTITPSGTKIVAAGNVTVNSNFALEGYATSRNVIRCVRLKIQPGATPGTNINVTDMTSAGAEGFNGPTITDATNLAKSGTVGSFSLNAGGVALTLNITPDVVGILGVSIMSHDINTSSTSEMYVPEASIVGSNLILNITKRGAVANVDWTTVMDSGDTVEYLVSFVTSS